MIRMDWCHPLYFEGRSIHDASADSVVRVFPKSRGTRQSVVGSIRRSGLVIPSGLKGNNRVGTQNSRMELNRYNTFDFD